MKHLCQFHDHWKELQNWHWGKRHPWVGFSQLYDSGSLLIQSLVRLHNRGIIFPPFTQICPCTTPAPDAFAAADHRLQLSRVSFTSQSNILFEARNIEWHSQVSVCGTVPEVSSPREHFITYLLQSVEKCNLLFYHFFPLNIFFFWFLGFRLSGKVTNPWVHISAMTMWIGFSISSLLKLFVV